MSILEIIKNNSQVSFYLFLTIMLIILFYPSNTKTCKKKESDMKFKNIFSNLKLFTDYTLL